MDKKILKDIKNEVVALMRLTKDGDHGISHVERVSKNAKKIVKIMKLEKKLDFTTLEAAIYLHDITFIYKKHNPYTYIFEGRLAANYARKILDGFKIRKKEKEIIIDAIRQHPHSMPFMDLNRKGDVYKKVLQDADTLDEFTEERITKLKEHARDSIGDKIAYWLYKHWDEFLIKRIHWFLNYKEVVPHFKKSFYKID